MSKRNRPQQALRTRKRGEFRSEAPPESAERKTGEQAAREAIARAEVEFPPVRGDLDRAPPDYERP